MREKTMVERGNTKPSQAQAKKPTRNPTAKELLTHKNTTKKTNPQKQPFDIHSFALSQENEQTLVNVKQDATDALGRPISASAILRALLRYAGQQPAAWIAKQIHPLIEAEVEEGRLWGTQSKTGRK
jgi:hypothetical protein